MAYTHRQRVIIERFEEMLDDVLEPYQMGGMTFCPSQILNSDPILFYQELLSWCDYKNIDFHDGNGLIAGQEMGG